MQWTVRDLAAMFEVSENLVARWTRHDGLPANNVGGELRFDVLSVFEWVTARAAPVTDQFLKSLEATLEQTCNLAEALERGGIAQHVESSPPETLVRRLAAELTLPAGFDRAALEPILLARGGLGLHLVGEGIAAPRPRFPLIAPGGLPAATLYFLQTPLPLPPDGQTIDTLFLLVCPTMGCHLSLLARLQAALQDPDFRGLVKQRQAHERIFLAAHRLQPLAPPVAQPLLDELSTRGAP